MLRNPLILGLTLAGHCVMLCADGAEGAGQRGLAVQVHRRGAHRAHRPVRAHGAGRRPGTPGTAWRQRQRVPEIPIWLPQGFTFCFLQVGVSQVHAHVRSELRPIQAGVLDMHVIAQVELLVPPIAAVGMLPPRCVVELSSSALARCCVLASCQKMSVWPEVLQA